MAARRARPSQRRRPCYTIVVVRAVRPERRASLRSARARGRLVLRIVSCVVADAAGKRRSQATLVQARDVCAALQDYDAFR